MPKSKEDKPKAKIETSFRTDKYKANLLLLMIGAYGNISYGVIPYRNRLLALRSLKRKR